MTSHVFLFKEILPSSPTLVLFGENTQNSKAQYVAKDVDGRSTEEVFVASRDVPSAMSERFFRETCLSKGVLS